MYQWEGVHSKVNFNEVGRMEASPRKEEQGLLRTGTVLMAAPKGWVFI